MVGKVGFVFFGSPQVAVKPFRQLRLKFQPLLVVTQPDKPVGRHQVITPTPVAQAAKQLKLPVAKPVHLSDDLLPTLAQLKPRPEFGFVFSYAKIIPDSIIDFFPKGIINLHPSLLPKYRGASPVRQAIIDRQTTTGWSLMLIDSQLDHGPILAQGRVAIKSDDTQATLLNRIIDNSLESLNLVIDNYLAGRLTPTPQDDRLASYTRLTTRDKAQINWQQDPLAIKAFVQAMQPWPTAFTWVTIKGKRRRLKIYKVKAQPNRLTPVTVQLEGKKPVSWETFIRAYSTNVLPAQMKLWLK